MPLARTSNYLLLLHMHTSQVSHLQTQLNKGVRTCFFFIRVKLRVYSVSILVIILQWKLNIRWNLWFVWKPSPPIKARPDCLASSQASRSCLIRYHAEFVKSSRSQKIMLSSENWAGHDNFKLDNSSLSWAKSLARIFEGSHILQYHKSSEGNTQSFNWCNVHFTILFFVFHFSPNL